MTMDDRCLDVLFRDARTLTAWQDRPVSNELLQQIYDLARLGPTAANSSPALFTFVRSPEAKARLRRFLDGGNIAKTMAAPVTVIVAYDLLFPDRLPKLYPHADARSWFAGNDALIQDTAFRNSSLQAAYFMLAARALGLDCGPMSGFNAAALDADFFPGGRVRSNLLINLGYGDRSRLHPRLPRLDFVEACEVM